MYNRRSIMSYTSVIPFVRAEVTIWQWKDDEFKMKDTFTATATFKETCKNNTYITNREALNESSVTITINGNDSNKLEKEINQAVLRRFALYYIHRAYDGKYMHKLVRSQLKNLFAGTNTIRLNSFDFGNSGYRSMDLINTLHYIEDNGYAVKCDSFKNKKFEDCIYSPQEGMTMILTDKGKEWATIESL